MTQKNEEEVRTELHEKMMKQIEEQNKMFGGNKDKVIYIDNVPPGDDVKTIVYIGVGLLALAFIAVGKRFDFSGLFVIGIVMLIGEILVLILEGLASAIEQDSKLSESEKTEKRNAALYGTRNGQMICPHCQKRGKVYIHKVDIKKGVSGGKAAAAVITGGWSLLATGLSRNERKTEAHCVSCENTWLI